MGTRVAALTAIVCALASLPGCSWIFVDGPPPEHARGANFTCTTDRDPPIRDTGLASTFAILGGALIYVGVTCDEPGYMSCLAEAAGASLGVVLLVPAILFAASAITGFVSTAYCRDALAAPRSEAPHAPTVPAPHRGANGALEYTFAMTGVRVDLRAIVGNTERVQVALSRLVAADRVSHTPCDTWSIVAGDNTTSVPGGLYRATREAAGQRETFGNEIPMSALRQFVDGSGQGLAAIDLCRERLYLSMTARNELARFFAELDAMVHERAAASTSEPIAPVDAGPP
jgi:hypothetical protein